MKTSVYRRISHILCDPVSSVVTLMYAYILILCICTNISSRI